MYKYKEAAIVLFLLKISNLFYLNEIYFLQNSLKLNLFKQNRKNSLPLILYKKSFKCYYFRAGEVYWSSKYLFILSMGVRTPVFLLIFL